MNIRTKIAALGVAAAVAIGGAVAVPLSNPTPAEAYINTDITNSGSLPIYTLFHTNYKEWLQPGWTFEEVAYVAAFGGQCVRWKAFFTSTWSEICNNNAFNPNDIFQNVRWIKLPDYAMWIERTR